MFSRIVCATDGSEIAGRALDVAKTLARENDAALVVAHVVERYATTGGLAVYPDEDQLAGRLEQLTGELSAEGLAATLKIVDHVGPQPAHEIADLAREEGADLLVVGTRGHGAVTGLVLGSVTLRLLHVAPCPVLVVPTSH